MGYYELLLARKLSGGGGGGSAVLIDKNISANGTYNASSDNADGYKKVVVNVPNPSTGTLSITENDTYDVTDYASVEVDVPQGITPTGTISITSNGTVDVTNYANADVNVSGGGDSSPFHLLGTVNVEQDVRGISVEYASYLSYDFLFLVLDVELTASDYLYFNFDSTTPASGSYSADAQLTFKGFYGFVMKPNGLLHNIKWAKTNSPAGFDILGTDIPKTNIYVSTYQASRLIKAGSAIRIYGGNYADL